MENIEDGFAGEAVLDKGFRGYAPAKQVKDVNFSSIILFLIEMNVGANLFTVNLLLSGRWARGNGGGGRFWWKGYGYAGI